MRKRRIEQARPIMWVVYVAAVLFSIGVLADKGPPLAPFPEKFESFDCHGVSLLNSVFHKSQMTLELSVPESIEYPPEYLPNFINVRASVGKANLSFDGDTIVAFAKRGNVMNVSFPFPFAGKSEVNIRCTNRFVESFTKEVDVSALQWDEYSAAVEWEDRYEFRGACVENDKILFMTKAKGSYPNVSFGNTSILVEFLKMPIRKYCQEKNIGIIGENSILLPLLPAEPAKLLLFVLPQLAEMVKARQSSFTFGRPEKSAIQVANMLRLHAPVNKSENMCFDSLVIPRLNPTMSLIDDVAVKQALARDITHLKASLRIPETHDKQIIVIAAGMMFKLENRIKEICPNCTLRVLDSDISGWLRKLEKAGTFVANHLTNLVAASLLSSGATLIDATPPNIQFGWAETYAKSLGLSYHPVHNSDEATCTSFACYPEVPSSVLTDDDANTIIEILRKTLFE